MPVTTKNTGTRKPNPIASTFSGTGPALSGAAPCSTRRAHGLWTAIAGGVLLSYRRPDGRFPFTGPVIGTFVGVSLLHALWDSTHGIALRLVARLASTRLDRELFAQGYLPHATDQQQHLFTVLSVGLMVLVSLFGVAWVRAPARREPSWRNTP
ncbi:hypothetical protein ABZ835_03625 [Streptomyces sp. NPDC047461]|uniref:hypothetical protein n=1 Tax=Streptomyces sp. NPDC047461 TaxID=3155619 RepID=UPI0034053AC9